MGIGLKAAMYVDLYIYIYIQIALLGGSIRESRRTNPKRDHVGAFRDGVAETPWCMPRDKLQEGSSARPQG